MAGGRFPILFKHLPDASRLRAIQGLVGHQPLQPFVSLLQAMQSQRFAELPPILRLPSVDRPFADPVSPGWFAQSSFRLDVLQEPDNLLFNNLLLFICCPSGFLPFIQQFSRSTWSVLLGADHCFQYLTDKIGFPFSSLLIPKILAVCLAPLRFKYDSSLRRKERGAHR